jgi:uncharacterized protein YodC (DUF2158 family)
MRPDEEFVSGDVVELKSGSPRMTVDCVSDRGVDVVFFPVDSCGGFRGDLVEATFSADALKKVSR